MNFNGKIIVKSDTIFLNFDKNSQLFLLAFFDFFWFFAIFFAGFEKKKGHQNLLANRYFLLAKIQKFPKMCSQKKNSHRRANNANNGISLGAWVLNI